MQRLNLDWKTALLAPLAIVIFFCVWSVFVWFGWNGFLVPQFGLKHLSYSEAGAVTLLWWLVFIFLLALRELGSS